MDRTVPLSLALACLLSGSLGAAPRPLPGAPEWKGPRPAYRLRLAVQKPGEVEPTRPVLHGVEAYHDGALGPQMVYLTQTGGPGVVPGKAPGARPLVRLHGFELKARRPSEFPQPAVPFGIAVYHDPGADAVIYVSHTGALAVLSARHIGPPAKVGRPDWSHGLDLRARRASEEGWEKAPRYGLEAYQDEAAGLMIYLTHTGQLAVVAAKGPGKDRSAKAPEWTHGLTLEARTADGKGTRKFGVEVFHDHNTHTTLYITETGALAAVPARAFVSLPRFRAPTHLHRRVLHVRPADRDGFDRNTPRFGVEAYRDEVNGNIIAISERGALAVWR